MQDFLFFSFFGMGQRLFIFTTGLGVLNSRVSLALSKSMELIQRVTVNIYRLAKFKVTHDLQSHCSYRDIVHSKNTEQTVCK